MNNRTLHLLAMAGVVVALLAGCADRSGSRGAAPTGSPLPPPASEPAASPAGSPSASATPPGSGAEPAARPTTARTITIAVWLTRDGKLFPTKRTRAATAATTRLALREIIAGPTSAEAAAGVRTTVPDVSFTASVSGGVATVDFPRAFYDGGRAAARLRQAQVVYTLTQFASVNKVGFQIAGEPAGWPVGRSEYADLLPAIVVTSLVIGQRVSSPVTIAGTANVYEATVSVRILDAAGAEIATGFTTATCGTGCRGEYATTLAYRVSRDQVGRVQAYEVSARDGSRVNLVDIPVTLTA
jgi:hypothetical protein